VVRLFTVARKRRLCASMRPSSTEWWSRRFTDGAHDIFLRGAELPGLSVQRVGPAAFAGQGRTLSSESGLALHIESHKGNEARRYLLDFGFIPNVHLNNLDLLKLDAAAVDALILSHGRRRGQFLPPAQPEPRRQLQRLRHTGSPPT
jgi:hypothetical protein